MSILGLMSVFSAPAQSIANETTPIKLIVGFPAGTPGDAVARIVQNRLTQELGRSVYVENKPGAGGALAVTDVGQATSNELVLMITGSVIFVEPLTTEQSTFDINKVQTVAELGDFDTMLVASKKFGITDYTKWPKDRKITYSTSGINSGGHIAGEYFKHLTRTDLVHIPYKGVALSIPDLLSGQVDLSFIIPVAAMPYIQSGDLLPIAVSGHKRHPALPNIPTFTELGLNGIPPLRFNLFANKNTTDQADIKKIQEILVKASKDPEYVNSLKIKGSLESVNSKDVIPPKDYMEQQSKFFAKILKDIAIQN